MKHIRQRKYPTTLLTTGILALAVVAFISQTVYAGPGCWAAKGKKPSCAVVACEAKTACVKTAAVSTEKKSEYTKEECIAKCMALGMTKKEAEACWAKCKEGKGNLHCVSRKDCITKLMASGLSKKEAEAKYVACKAEGKSSPKCLKSAPAAACCPASSGKKNTPK